MSSEFRPAPDLGWHVICGEDIMGMLYQVWDGDDPGVVFAEFWANTEHDSLSGGGVDIGGEEEE